MPASEVVNPSSRKEQKENTTALKFCSARRIQRATNFTICGVPLPGDTEGQRRIQRENSAFAKRKREKIHHGGSEFFCADPTPAQLSSLVNGRDKAVIKPPRSKADQDGTIWGAHPIWLTLDETDVANPARWLRQLELAFPLGRAAR